MSANPFLKRVLGEEIEPEMPEGSPAPPPRPEAELPPEPAEDADADGAAEVSVSVQELAQMWQSGQQMDVATELMFTPASYADFVDLCFIIGQSEGRKLGHMLDELADSENVPVPEPSSDYSSVLQRVAANRGGRSMTTNAI